MASEKLFIFAAIFFTAFGTTNPQTGSKCSINDRIIKCTKFSPLEIRELYALNKRVTTLDLSNLQITLLMPKNFRMLNSVSHIYLDGSSVDYVLNDTFSLLKRLKFLSLKDLKSSVLPFVESIESSDLLAVDIGGTFKTCTCTYWKTYLRINNSGTSVINSKKLPYCSFEDVNKCSGHVYVKKSGNNDLDCK